MVGGVGLPRQPAPDPHSLPAPPARPDGAERRSRRAFRPVRIPVDPS